MNQTVLEAPNQDLAAGVSHAEITAAPIEIKWDPSLPVFAKEEFLHGVGDQYGWLGGTDQSGTLRCILPYTIVRKTGLRMVRFRNETIARGAELDILEEKCFLNSVVQYFRTTGADVIIPASNNALFRTYPDGARVAPYGSFVVDLQHPEDVLWRNVSKTTKQGIVSAQKDGVIVREGIDLLDPAYDSIRETFSRSKMGFMSRDSFRRFALSLGENCKILVAEQNGVGHSYSLCAFSTPSAFWVYGGNIQDQHPGAAKLLQWEAIRIFRGLGVLQVRFLWCQNRPSEGLQAGGHQQYEEAARRHARTGLSAGSIPLSLRGPGSIRKPFNCFGAVTLSIRKSTS